MNRGRPLLGLADRAVALFFSAVPSARRFPVAWLLARTTGPVVRLLPAIEKRALYIDSRSDSYILRLLLRSLRRGRLLYPTPLESIGAAALVHAHADGQPIIVCVAHESLLGFVAHALEDAGLHPVVVMTEAKDEEQIMGRRTAMRVIVHSPNTLVEIRSAARRGEVPFVVIDSPVPKVDGIAIPTRAGTRFVGPALFQIATRCGVDLFFASTTIRNGKVQVTFEPLEGDTPQKLMAAAASKVAEIVKECGAAAPFSPRQRG